MVGVRSTDRNEELSQEHKNDSEAKGWFLNYLHFLHVDVDNIIQSWGADVCGYPQPTDYTQPRGCILLSEADKGGVNLHHKNRYIYLHDVCPRQASSARDKLP